MEQDGSGANDPGSQSFRQQRASLAACGRTLWADPGPVKMAPDWTGAV